MLSLPLVPLATSDEAVLPSPTTIFPPLSRKPEAIVK